MIYYVFFIFVIVLFRLFTNALGKRGKKTFFVLSTAFVVLFQGLRSFTVGIDLIGYIPSYAAIGLTVPFSLTAQWQNYEIGYILLNKLLYSFGLDERWFLIVITSLIQIPIFYTMYKYSEMPLLSILLYFAFGNFTMTFSGLRQSLAMALCFFAYNFVRKRKPLFFFLMVLLASTFHTSALLCFFVYPIYRLKIGGRSLPLTIALVLLCFLFRSQIFSLAARLYYGGERTIVSTGAYTMFAAYFLLYIMANILSHNKNDSDYIGLTNIMLLNTLVFSLASVSNTISRIGYPFTLYTTIFVPKFVKNVVPQTSKWQDFFRFACYATCIFAFFYFINAAGTKQFSFMGTDFI